MNKKFATYKIAKELKELGFNEPCLGIFKNEDSVYCDTNKDYLTSQEKAQYIFGNEKVVIYLAPTWQDIIEWLEEKHKLFIDVFPTLVSVSDKTGHRFTWDIVDLDDYVATITDTSTLGFLTSYEAREDAILKSIEIIKNKLK